MVEYQTACTGLVSPLEPNETGLFDIIGHETAKPFAMGKFGPVKRAARADVAYGDRWGEPYKG